MTRTRLVFIASGVLLALLLLGPVVVPLVLPWSEINCVHREINLKTGRQRTRRFVWYLCIDEVEGDTPLSVALDGERVEVSPIEEWQPSITLSFYTNQSPHYRFHSALYQAECFGAYVRTAERMAPGLSRKAAREILRAWQLSNGDGGAEIVLMNLRMAGGGE